MVSTYLSYDLVTRDIKKSLVRVGQETQVARDAAYYKANIGKVTTVEQFLADDRLYSYAMLAHGLEDMTYAKAFMKKVLESDLSDEDSYANKLTDDRYRNFAASFTFGTSTATAQSSAQIDDIIGLYNDNIKATGESVIAESRYYNAVINGVTSVDSVLQNDRLRSYIFTAYGLPESNYSFDVMKKVLSSDPSDPAGYVNANYGSDYIAAMNQGIADVTASATAAELANKSSTASMKITAYQNAITKAGIYQNLSQVFNFSADGTLPAGTLPQTDTQKSITNDLYLTNQPRVTPTAALVNKAYYEAAMANVTKIQDIIDDGRLLEYVVKSYDLPSTLSLADLRSILSSDLNDPASFANSQTDATLKAKYIAMAGDFNFQSDLTVPTGETAQTAEQLARTSAGYMVYYNDDDEAADEALIAAYKTGIAKVTTVEEFVANASVKKMALLAFGLDSSVESDRKLKKILSSDLNDPKSYVYTLKDQRYVDLAKAYNFDTKGAITAPVAAQSEATITATASAYIVNMTRFVDSKEKAGIREKADTEAEYYQNTILTIDSSQELLADSRLVNFILVAKGIDPETVTSDYLKQMFASDLDDPKSFANTEPDERFGELVASFNFDTAGALIRDKPVGIQARGEMLETANMYLHQTMETEEGDSNAGVRLALYFERMASTVTDAYDILGDTALLEVFRTTYSLPADISNMDIDQQAKLVEKYMDLTDLQDPEKLNTLVKRFTIMYDLENNVASSPALSLLTASSNVGISADTLLSLSQIRAG